MSKITLIKGGIMFLFKRGKNYHFEYYDEHQNKTKRITTGCQTKMEATKFISQFLVELKNRQNLKNIYLKDFAEEYQLFSTQKLSKYYSKRVGSTLKKFIETIGNPNVYKINEEMIEKHIMSIYIERPGAARWTLYILMGAFKKAIEWKYIEHSPCVKIKLPKRKRNLPVTISRSALELITSSIKAKVLRELIVVGYYTGMRLAELANIKWSSVDFEHRTLLIKNSLEFTTKNKRERIIPMSRFVFQILQRQVEKSKSDYVFPNSRKHKYSTAHISRYFKQGVRAAGLSEEIHFHCLRHSFASNLVRKGVSLYIVKELLGHASISTTQIYAHLDNSSLIKAVDLLD